LNSGSMSSNRPFRRPRTILIKRTQEKMGFSVYLSLTPAVYGRPEGTFTRWPAGLVRQKGNPDSRPSGRRASDIDGRRRRPGLHTKTFDGE